MINNSSQVWAYKGKCIYFLQFHYSNWLILSSKLLCVVFLWDLISMLMDGLEPSVDLTVIVSSPLHIM